jgi:hypothetical protein
MGMIMRARGERRGLSCLDFKARFDLDGGEVGACVGFAA